MQRIVLLARVLDVLELLLDLDLNLGRDIGVKNADTGRASALLAPASPPPVLADLRAPALLALVSPPPVLADARAPALLALVSPPPVLAGFRV